LPAVPAQGYCTPSGSGTQAVRVSKMIFNRVAKQYALFIIVSGSDHTPFT
jgi:hypothetical protein